MTRCIVSCAYSDDGRYVKYSRRLEESLQKWGYQGAYKCWTESFPPDSPTHRQLHYAFKYYAIKWALDQGYMRVLWLDAAAYATAPIDPIWDELDRRGVYVVAGDEPLGEWISDQALTYFATSRDQAMDLRLCGGAIIGLDIDTKSGVLFLYHWKRLVKTKLFVTAHSKFAPDKMKSLWVSDHDETLVVSEDIRVKGHRADEACFSLVLRDIDIKPVDVAIWNKVMCSGY